jgi:hypothetical protein
MGRDRNRDLAREREFDSDDSDMEATGEDVLREERQAYVARPHSHSDSYGLASGEQQTDDFVHRAGLDLPREKTQPSRRANEKGRKRRPSESWLSLLHRYTATLHHRASASIVRSPHAFPFRFAMACRFSSSVSPIWAAQSALQQTERYETYNTPVLILIVEFGCAALHLRRHLGLSSGVASQFGRDLGHGRLGDFLLEVVAVATNKHVRTSGQQRGGDETYKSSSSASLRKVMAVPVLPARPVRPIR